VVEPTKRARRNETLEEALARASEAVLAELGLSPADGSPPRSPDDGGE
jgi:hypothetical protein